MKHDFLEYISNHVFHGVRNLGNKSAMKVIFLFANVENFMYISKIQEKIEKKLFVFEIIASELVALNCVC